jgi:protocatechuate 3,4-dioxygenase beta subunit
MNSEITINNIAKARVAGLIGLGLLFVAALATQAFSQTILIDDFNDGNADGWTTRDRTVGRPWGPGTFDASSGAYQLEMASIAPGTPGRGYLASFWDQSSDSPMFSDGFVRAKVRVETLGSMGLLLLRISGNLDTGGNVYQFGPTTAFNGFVFVKIVKGVNVQVRRVPGNFSLRLNDWWNIEAGAVGDQLSMKVWRDGEPEPESPQLIFRDSDFLGPGYLGVQANIDNEFREATRASATFDDIYFRFPEHKDVYTVSPYNTVLWEAPMPVPQQEGPYFVAGSPEKPDMRGDVTKADGWPDLHLTGKVTDFDGKPVPGIKLDFWQTDDQGNYDNSGGYDLRGHVYTDAEGNYDLWTIVPAAYETVRTRHLHLKIGGVNMGFNSPVYTTQLYFPAPYDNDIDADGTPDKVVQDGVETDFDAISLEDDFFTLADLLTVGAEFSDLTGNILTLNNNPAIAGYFDATLDIVMPEVFQSPEMAKRILIDNFNDGNDDGWDHGDNTDQPFGPAIYDANSGAYRLASTGLLWEPQELRDSGDFSAAWAASSSDPLFYSHGLFRFRFRIDGSGTSFEFAMRAKEVAPGAFSFYAFGADSVPDDTGAFSFRRVEAGVSKAELVEINPPPPYLYQEEWMLEAGAVGDRLTMKWWPVGAPEPNDPQWEWIDPDPLGPGIIGTIIALSTGAIEYNNVPPPWWIDTTIDDIYFTPSDVEDNPSGRR